MSRRVDLVYAPGRTCCYVPPCGELRGFSADQRTRPRQDALVATDGYVQIIWDGPESEHTGTPARCHYVSTTQTPPVLAAELAQAWADIQRHHPELPDLAAPESLIGESSSACGHELSFERLLHEAVHGIAAARGVRDTSRPAGTTTADSSRSPRNSASTTPRNPTPAVVSRWSRSIPRPSVATARPSRDCSALSRHTPRRPPRTRPAASGARPPATVPRAAASASRPSATAVATSASSPPCSPRHPSSVAAAASPSGSRRSWARRETRVSREDGEPTGDGCSWQPYPVRGRRVRPRCEQSCRWGGAGRRRRPVSGAKAPGAGCRFGMRSHSPGERRSPACGTMASCTRQSHRTPLSSG